MAQYYSWNIYKIFWYLELYWYWFCFISVDFANMIRNTKYTLDNSQVYFSFFCVKKALVENLWLVNKGSIYLSLENNACYAQLITVISWFN
jgi:hypothetical protein